MITRKFSGSAKAWLAAIGSRVAAKDVPSAQTWLERATKVLPQRKHVKVSRQPSAALCLTRHAVVSMLSSTMRVQVLSQTAVAYFRAGQHEQGRNILDSVLRSYPKRLDLWFLYADQVRKPALLHCCMRDAQGADTGLCVQEAKWGEATRVRSLYERGTHSDLPARKVKMGACYCASSAQLQTKLSMQLCR